MRQGSAHHLGAPTAPMSQRWEGSGFLITWKETLRSTEGNSVFSCTGDLRHSILHEATQVQVLGLPVLLNSHQAWEWIRANCAFLCQEWKGKRMNKKEVSLCFPHFPLGSWFVRSQFQLLGLPRSWLPWLWLLASSVTQAACSLAPHSAFYPWERDVGCASLPSESSQSCLIQMRSSAF